jgi:hypothetical protein
MMVKVYCYIIHGSEDTMWRDLEDTVECENKDAAWLYVDKYNHNSADFNTPDYIRIASTVKHHD